MASEQTELVLVFDEDGEMAWDGSSRPTADTSTPVPSAGKTAEGPDQVDDSGIRDLWRTTFETDPARPKGARWSRTAVPAQIAALPVPIGQAAARRAAHASMLLTRADVEASVLARQASFDPSWALLAVEALASSRIEGIEETAVDLLGRTGGLTLSNLEAVRAGLIVAGDADPAGLHAVHRTLLEDSRPDLAGQVRTGRVGVGTYVAPRPELLGSALDDLAGFARRDDLDPFVQSAITHAQVETIHPYADGNGRTGRALVNAMLTSRDVTPALPAVLSVHLLRNRSRYYAALIDFRAGTLDPIIELYAEAAERSAVVSGQLVADMVAIRHRWQWGLEVRSDAVAWKMLAPLLAHPVVTAQTVMAAHDVTLTAAQRAIDQLTEIEALTQITEGRRNRRWAATEVVDAIDRAVTGR